MKQENDLEPLLVVLLGPTGSGKTSLSLYAARRFSGEVVSCDSVAVYRDLEIGAAKPTKRERCEIRHHLIDVASPEKTYSAGEYSRVARAAIHKIVSLQQLPIVTGGSGLYLRALLNGLFAGPERSDALRDRLRSAEVRRGPGYLHRLLRRLDAKATAVIHANDQPKLIRAIEVSLRVGKPMTEAWKMEEKEPLRGYKVLRIGLDPERRLLYERINARAAGMFAHGLVEETRMLMEKYRPDLRVLDSLGYRQARAHLRGELTLAAAVERAQQGHRNYAKRQMTWFRREPNVHWLRGFGDDPVVQEEAERLIRTAARDQVGAKTCFPDE